MTFDELRPGMIGLSGGGSFIQKCIRYFTGSDFSHSFTLILGPYGILSAIETSSTIIKVTDIKPKMTEPEWIQVWSPMAPQEQIQAALEKTYQEYSGCRYGYESYLWFLWRWFNRKVMHKEITRVWDWASKGVTCTELTCYFLSQINADFAELFEKKDYSAQSPQELKEIMMQNPGMFRYWGWLISKE